MIAISLNQVILKKLGSVFWGPPRAEGVTPLQNTANRRRAFMHGGNSRNLYGGEVVPCTTMQSRALSGIGD